ncbi:MAG: hypothetical protein FJ271_30975 [Planctomycetes bacterium]|nr:hypothetical protein [Planctomycetota bacterium]
MTEAALPFTTMTIKPELAGVLRQLRPGQKLRITHTVRVGSQSWPAVVTGTFRHLGSLATGIATHRLPQDDIIIPTIHLTKDNQELTSVTLDEHTRIEVLA